MATLRNKRKLAAVSRETPEGTRNSRAQKRPDPELTQEYISQVSEEIEGRVTKKLLKEFSKTESRIFGALSKLDEFLLNPQVRTCSVAVPGTSRNNNSENRETTQDRSSDDPCPEVRYSSHHSGHLNCPEARDYPDSPCWLRMFVLFYFFTSQRCSERYCLHIHFKFSNSCCVWFKYSPFCQFSSHIIFCFFKMVTTHCVKK